jgi:hypothetical protein
MLGFYFGRFLKVLVGTQGVDDVMYNLGNETVDLVLCLIRET